MDLSSGVTIADEIAARIPDEAGARWWVAHTRNRHEKAFAENLARMGLVHYLPMSPRVTRSRSTGRVSRSIVPIFPGYVFFSAGEEQRLRALATQHVAQTIPVVDQQKLVRELREIERVLRVGETLSRAGKLARGERVRVIAGPLMGLEGVVTRWKTRLRIMLNVEILGQAAAVETDADLCERVEA